ncbi:MAG: protein kinase [Chlamydiae bacterium]|nr:protein kinase [Chlamydiota bacterium]
MIHQESTLILNRYLIKKTLGSGGMGEVYLAYDKLCKRNVALKQLKETLRTNDLLKKRFLREAKIASQLSHPAIIPIYDIYENELFYTMPYVEGETLKTILQKTKDEKLEKSPPFASSIFNLTRIFINVCEAAAYTHSKGIIHRDLKPDNIILGKFGEVLILDWGIAKFASEKEEEYKEIFAGEDFNLTRPGKISGTLAYMAPERAISCKSTFACDIYSLGAILYQILTLEMPFKRPDLATFKKNLKLERLIDPLERAPHRDIPLELAKIAKKALDPNPLNRYLSIGKLIDDLNDYINGKPTWVLVKELDIEKQEDWAFQENFLLPQHVAITNQISSSEWVSMMLSKEGFASNIKIEADLILHKKSKGLGFLISSSFFQQHPMIEEGYRIWLKNKKDGSSQLFFSNVLVMESKEASLNENVRHLIRIEKVQDELSFYLDGKLIFSHMSHLPLKGNKIGLIYQDTNFTLSNIKIYSSSHNFMINCLAIPDFLYAHENFEQAIQEYRKIGFSFFGRSEGREAIFRSGVALLDMAGVKKKKNLFNEALLEFEKLHTTNSAPLEYLGKSLAYAKMQDFEEEAKCLELAIRKFANHPLVKVIEERIIYRMHESSLQNREPAYLMILIALRHIDNILENKNTKNLLKNFQDHLEPLYFIEKSDNLKEMLAIDLSFRLNKSSFILEMLQDLDEINFENGLFALLELNDFATIKQIKKKKSPLFEIVLSSQKSLKNSVSSFFLICHKNLNKKEVRALIYLLKKALFNKDFVLMNDIFTKVQKLSIPSDDKLLIDSFFIWKILLEKKHSMAKRYFDKYQGNLLEEKGPLHFLFGCYLLATKGKIKAKKYFSSILHTHYPWSYALAAHYLTSSEQEKFISRLFLWEKKQLFEHLALYYFCKKEFKKQKHFESLLRKLPKAYP